VILHVNPVDGPAGVGDDELVTLLIQYRDESLCNAFLRARERFAVLPVVSRETWIGLTCSPKYRAMWDDIIWHADPLPA